MKRTERNLDFGNSPSGAKTFLSSSRDVVFSQKREFGRGRVFFPRLRGILPLTRKTSAQTHGAMSFLSKMFFSF